METNERKYCVYVHTNKFNGKKYVGVTSMKPEERWRNGNGYPHNTYFTRAIKKYGWDDGFTHEIIAEDLSVDDAYQMEKDLIAEYDCINPNGYNATSGGEIGKEYSEELRQRLSEIITERMSNPEVKAKMADAIANRDYWGENNPNYGNHKLAGENNPNYGKKASAETRAKIGDAHRGKTWPEERRQEFSEKMKGKPGHPCSEETKEKISRANTGRTLTQEQKDNLSKRFSGTNNPNYGKHWSEEMKKQIGDKLRGENSPNYGKHPSVETIQKMRENNGKNRAVLQFDMSGTLIKRHCSLSDAERETGVSYSCISVACTNHSSAGGFLWRYEDEYNPNIPVVYTNNNLRAVVQLYLENGEFIAEYESGREAHRITGIPHQNIGRCCRGQVKHAGGFDWWYKTEYDEEFTKQND